MVNPPRGWNDITGIQAPELIRQFAGFSSMDTFSLEDNVMVKNKNIGTKEAPAARVREGFKRLPAISSPIMGIGSWKEDQLNVIAGGRWRSWRGSYWAEVGSSLNTSAKWSFTNFKGNFPDVALIAANGVDGVKVYDGTSIRDLENAPAGMNFVTSHENRLYGAVDNSLHYSALRKPTDWNTVDESGQIVIENNNGEKISCVIGGTGKIVIFLPHSMHELYGTGPLNFKLQLITEEIGCVSHQSAVMVSGILFFLSHDGIYRYTGGATPQKDFSLPIQNIVETINHKAWHTVTAGSDGERYYISLPINGASEPNITLEYDPMYNLWNIWDFGHVPTAFGRVQEQMYVGVKEGFVLEMGGNDDAGALTPYMIETKPFSYGSLAAHARLYRLWVVADIPQNATMHVYISNKKDGDTDWTLVKTIASTTDMVATPIHIPVNKSFYANWVRIKIEGHGQVTLHEISRQSRVFRFGLGGG
ncbi:MAG: hypothetical protein RR595_12710 [Lysinibacillus sp.]